MASVVVRVVPVPPSPAFVRRWPSQLYSTLELSRRPYRWTTPNGDVVTLTAAIAFESGALEVSTEDATGARTLLGAYPCDESDGASCQVFVNEREDGQLVLRFEEPRNDFSVGRVVVTQWTRVDGIAREDTRWEGTSSDYHANRAPEWTRLHADDSDAIALDAQPTPSGSCGNAMDCNDRGDNLRLAGSLRLALGFYLAALERDPGFVSAIYDAAQIYAAKDDVEHAIVMLERLATIDSADAHRAIARIRREHDFREIRDDPRVRAITDR